jgi:acyl-CoA reductase-like NAD-dependent aldehyde dehydrogenase
VIGGELVEGRATESDPVLNPASEEVLAEIPSATVEDVFSIYALEEYTRIKHVMASLA